MHPSRREFVEQFTIGAAALGGIPLAGGVTGLLDAARPAQPATAENWDLSWVNKLTGKHKAVFDVPEVESGYGVWRATIWTNQYRDVLGVPAQSLSPVVVLRHHGIVLAMQQGFWDKYEIGKAKSVTHPATMAPTDRNPALLSSARGEIPAEYDSFALDKYLERGGITLACNLALQDCADLIKSKDGVTPEVARKQAIGWMVPGVILQPSGVFGVLRAQEAGCGYIRAS